MCKLEHFRGGVRMVLLPLETARLVVFLLFPFFVPTSSSYMVAVYLIIQT